MSIKLHSPALRRLTRWALAAWIICGMAAPLRADTPSTASALGKDPDSVPAGAESWAVHAQATVVYQYHPAFASAYRGPNSLTSAAQGRETVDVTLYAGIRPWAGAELWLDPEIDQGFGLSDTLGVAAYPSGEAYKVGASRPYGRLHRAFVRQTLALGGETTEAAADLNQLAGTQSADRLVMTAGKFSVVDVFDANAYAHDPRGDFLNWSLIDSAAFDYAANSWGYTYGAAAEWYQGAWAVRLGAFGLSTSPNSTQLDPRIGRNHQLVAEVQRSWSWRGQPGAMRVLGFALRGGMGDYAQATALAEPGGQPAGIEAVRRTRTKYGRGVNLEQQVAPGVGVFARLSAQQGRYEAFDFTDVSRSFAAGLALSGSHWGRGDDTLGIGAADNRASGAALRFFDAGGLGILVGDGHLTRPGPERVFESYYRHALGRGLHATLDYQFIDHPGYNRDRGPVSIIGARLHAQF